MGATPCAFSFHVHSSKGTLDLEKIQARFVPLGCFVFAINPKASRVAIIPAVDKYEAIKAMGTNGANHNLLPADIIRWLRRLEAKQPFVLIGIGFDFLSGKFTSRIANARTLARKMLAFCPDLDSVENVGELAAELAKHRRFFFWWD